MSQQESDQSLDSHIDDLIDKIDVSGCNKRDADFNYSPHRSSSASEVSLLNPPLPSLDDDEESISKPTNSKKLTILDFKHPYKERVSLPLIHDSTGNTTIINTHTEELTFSKINEFEAIEITKHRNLNQVVNFIYKHSQRLPSTLQSVLIDQQSNHFLYLKNIMERIERPLLFPIKETHKFSPVKLYFTSSNENKMSTYFSFSSKSQMQNAPKKSRTSLRSSEYFNKPPLSWTNSSALVFESSQATSNKKMIEEIREPKLFMNKSDNFIRPQSGPEVQYCTLNEVISRQNNKSLNHSHGLKKLKLITEVSGYIPLPWHGVTTADNFESFRETRRRKVHTLPIIEETSDEVIFSNPNTHIQQECLVPLEASEKVNIQRIGGANLGPLSLPEKEENTFDEFNLISIKHTIKLEEPSFTLMNEEESNVPKYSEEKYFELPFSSNLDSPELQNDFTLDHREDALSAFTKANKCHKDNQLVPDQDNISGKRLETDNLWQYNIQHSSEIKLKTNSTSSKIDENYSEKNDSEADDRQRQFDKSPPVVVYNKNEDKQEIKACHSLNQQNSGSVLVTDKSFLNSNNGPNMKIKPHSTTDPEDDLDEEHRVPECNFNDHVSVRETSMYIGQSQNLTDCELQTQGAFYWNNRKNSSGYNLTVTSPENPALSTLISLPHSSQCNRPIRLGLSKKQKVKHLHKK